MPEGTAEEGALEEVSELLGVDATTLPAAVRSDLKRTFRKPYEIPVIIASNALLLLVLWWLVPHSYLTRLHGNFALPLVLSSWMFSDVSATNTLAAGVSTAARRIGGASQPPGGSTHNWNSHWFQP